MVKGKIQNIIEVLWDLKREKISRPILNNEDKDSFLKNKKSKKGKLRKKKREMNKETK